MSGIFMPGSLVKKTGCGKAPLFGFLRLFLLAFRVMLCGASGAHRLIVGHRGHRRVARSASICGSEALGPVAAGGVTIEKLGRCKILAIVLVELAEQLGGRARIDLRP